MSDAAITLIDTHAHLDQEDFEADRADVLARAREAGVMAVVSVGISLASSRATVALATENEGVYAAVGIHPNECGDAAASDWDQVLALYEAPRVVAVGETGLDNHWQRVPLEVQQDYFDRHLRVAQRRDLPIIIHSRESTDDIIAMLRDALSRGPLRGVMHSFTGTAEQAAECLDLGLEISFAGMVTFKKSDALRAVAATIAVDRILVETDSPYLSPEPRRGKPNEPAHVAHTATRLAEVRGVSLAEFAAQTTANARRLFGFR